MRTRSVLSFLGAMIGFAIAYRSVGQRHSVAIERLKPRAGNPRAEDQQPDLARGANAASPQDIPALGWWQVFKRVTAKFSENELLAEAAGCTFYALLSLFPAITAIVSVYGLFADRSAIEKQLSILSSLLPSGGMEIISEQVHRLTQSPTSGLSFGAVVGLLAALWSANAGTKAMLSALNSVYGEHETRGFVKVTAISLTFTIGAVVFLVFGAGLVVILPIVSAKMDLADAYALASEVLAWPVILLLLVVALAVLYRYGPSRRKAQWQWVSWGSAIAAIAWIAVSIGFSWYVAHFGSYNKTYGSLGAIIGFMTWIWLSTTVLLVGAQINAELEVQTGRDSTVGAAQPAGSRGAASADKVA